MFVARAVSRQRGKLGLRMMSLSVSGIVTPPPGLSRHVRAMMIDGLSSWYGSEGEKNQAADKLTSTLLSAHAASSKEGAKLTNKALFEEAKLVHKACKTRAGVVLKESSSAIPMVGEEIEIRVEDILKGNLGASTIITQYHEHLSRNKAVYKTIVSRHEGIKDKGPAVDPGWESESLKQYAEAASRMGSKVWCRRQTSG